jgi:hypothetical protein
VYGVRALPVPQRSSPGFLLNAVRSISAVAALCLAAEAHATSLRFTNVTAEAGITHVFHQPAIGTNTTGNSVVQAAWYVAGAVAEDFNGDGWVDLYALQANRQTNILYLNSGTGSFVIATAGTGLDLASNSVGACASDIDNDGDTDLVVTHFSNFPSLLLNDGSGVFTRSDLNHEFGIYPFSRYMSPSLGDVDNDGQLEVVVGLWNVGQCLIVFDTDGTNWNYYESHYDHGFDNQNVFTPHFADFDGDRDQDLAVVADFLRTQLYRNTGQTNLLRVTTSSGDIATDQNGMGCATGDYDNDGDLDWFVSSITDTNGPPYGNWGTTGNRLYRNDGAGFFSDATDEAGVRDGNWGWGACFVDFDNDGDLDLFHTKGFPATLLFTNGTNPSVMARFYDQPARLFENRGDGTFTNVAADAGADDKGEGRAVVPFDYDNDGDVDLFIANNQVLSYSGTNVVREPASPTLLRNDTPATNNWLKVTLDGTPPFHRNGIGSRAWLTAGGTRQLRELHASSGFLGHGPNRIAHFGLGTNAIAQEVRAEWVNGAATLVENVAANTNVSLPSPAATVSTNAIRPGELFTAWATNVPPLGTPRYWIVNGVSNADPLVTTLYSGATNDLRLRVFDGSGTNLVRTELHRVRVRDTEVGALGRYFLPNQWFLIWSYESGRVYRMQWSTNGIDGPWTNASSLFTPTDSGAYFLTVTSTAPNAVYRVLEFAP